MNGRGAAAVAIPAGVLALILLLVILIGGGGSSAAASPLPGGLAAGAALNAAAIPNQAWVAWVIKAGALCATFSAPVIAAQIDDESGWNPNAVSPAGAQGVAQFEPGTWPAYSNDDVGDGHVSPFNPVDAIMAQGRYDCALAADVAGIAATSGQTVLTLALDAYNAGPGAVAAAGGVPQIPETEAYAPRIEALAAMYAARRVLVADVSGGGSAFGQALVADAVAESGSPYVWGGGTPLGASGSATAPSGYLGQSGFDCSGLVLFAAFQASAGQLHLPHSSDEQARIGTAVATGGGQRVLASGLLEPGDVIGFQLGATGVYDHIGIYAGNGTMIVAAHTGTLVGMENLDTPYWLDSTWSARRYG